MIFKAATKTLILAGTLCISGLPAYADDHIEAVEWDRLPAETREALAPVAERWSKLKPHQQHRLLRRVNNNEYKNRAERWKNLSPAERQRIIEARKRFKDMPPEKRRELRKRWENMSDQEKREARERRPVKPDKKKNKDKRNKDKKKRDQNSQK